jgi:hypothetical protein
MNPNTRNLQRTLKTIFITTFAIVIAGCSTTSPSGGMVEWSEFKVAPGVSEDTMLKAADSVHENFLRKHKGFVRWELLKGKDGQWSALLYWNDQASVDAAMLNVEHSPSGAACFKGMANPEAVVPLCSRVKTYKR